MSSSLISQSICSGISSTVNRALSPAPLLLRRRGADPFVHGWCLVPPHLGGLVSHFANDRLGHLHGASRSACQRATSLCVLGGLVGLQYRPCANSAPSCLDHVFMANVVCQRTGWGSQFGLSVRHRGGRQERSAAGMAALSHPWCLAPIALKIVAPGNGGRLWAPRQGTGHDLPSVRR